MNTTVQSLTHAIEAIAPPHLAEPWDNVGLLLGSESWALSGPVMLTIDLTEAVADEAIAAGCSAVIAYHPPIFHPLKRITDQNGSQRIILKLLGAGGGDSSAKPKHGAHNRGVAVYSPHTALDAAAGGLTDWLADGLLQADASHPAAGGDRRALRPSLTNAPTQQMKIVTFVPAADADRVREALATAGAGIIGHYELCSFQSEGTGTFRGMPGTNPKVGKPSQFERTPELRLEMVCSRSALALALETLGRFHPYEEPAVDVYELVAKPARATGAGRRLTLDQPTTLEQLADRLKAHLGIRAVEIAAAGAGGVGRGERPAAVTRLGVVPGSGGELASEAIAQGCELFVTGEMKHHEILAAVAAGMSVMLAGHTQTERGYLPRLASRLADALPTVKFNVSTVDRQPGVLSYRA